MIKRLAACVREYKKDSLLSPLYVTLEVVIEVIIPLLMAKLIDYGVTAGNRSYLLKMGITLVILACVSMLFGALSGRYAARASSGFARNLRHDLYVCVQNFSFANIDKFSTAGIVTRLTTDVTNLQNAYQMIIRIAVRAPITLLLSLVMAFFINAQLSIILLCAIPILGLGLFFIMQKAHPLFNRVFDIYDGLNNVVQENLRGIRVVKSFVSEKRETEKFNAVSQDIYKLFSKAEKTTAINTPLMQLCLYACVLLISWVGAKLIVGSSMTTGQLVSFIAYAVQILMSLMMFSMVLVMVIIARSSAERTAQLLDEVCDLTNPENPITTVANGAVVFENVAFSYEKDAKKFCLQKVNIEIKSGETIGILGGTGSAKTSLVQLIPRLYDATQGRVLVGGEDVRAYDIEALREAVAMVLQKNELFSGTIRENLLWGNANATDEEMVHACTLAQADEFISAFPNGYNTRIEQGGSNVSGGQKQRLCIARALLKKPKILILDDSTSAVDTKTDALIRKAFRQELPSTTKIIIAQRVSSIEDADRILVLDNGLINGLGTHEELLKSNAIYGEIYRSQNKAQEQKGGMEHE